jgi:hypothetical protein
MTSSAVTVWPCELGRTSRCVAKGETMSSPRPCVASRPGCLISGLVSDFPSSVTEIASACFDRARTTWKAPLGSPLAVWRRALVPSSDDQNGVVDAWLFAQDLAHPAAGPADFLRKSWATEPPDSRTTHILVHTSSFMLVGHHG